MKRTPSLTAALIITAFAFAAFARATAAQQPQQDEFRWHEPLAAGRAIEIKGVNGNVEAVPAAGGEVEVVAVKRARRSNAADVRVEVVRHGGGVTICAVYPNVPGQRENECVPGDGGHMSVNNNDTSVNFTVRVPAGVRFVGRTVNGNVSAEGLTSDAEARTVNGNVEVSTAGLARAGTVNGNVVVSMGRADLPDDLEFKTVNGNIELRLPSALSAELEAKTLNGNVSADFPMTVRGSYSRRRLTGTVGAGGRGLRLETVNGTIRIRPTT